MRLRQHIASLHVVALTASAAVWAAEPPPLRHNPFSRPPSNVLADSGAQSAGVGDVPGEVDLRATMVASTTKLANVAGRILRPGEEFHGLTLLDVFEDRAVFASGGRRLTVYVKPDLVQEDD